MRRNNQKLLMRKSYQLRIDKKEHHPLTTVKNVLVGINNFNFLIDIVTLGIEENEQVSSSRKSSKSKSQALIDTKNG